MNRAVDNHHLQLFAVLLAVLVTAAVALGAANRPFRLRRIAESGYRTGARRHDDGSRVDPRSRPA